LRSAAVTLSKAVGAGIESVVVEAVTRFAAVLALTVLGATLETI
jgi:hypothetical protein